MLWCDQSYSYHMDLSSIFLWQVVILDVRVPCTPVARLNNHRACVNGIAWAPHSSCHICTAGEWEFIMSWNHLSVLPEIHMPGMLDLKHSWLTGCRMKQDKLLSFRANQLSPTPKKHVTKQMFLQSVSDFVFMFEYFCWKWWSDKGLFTLSWPFWAYHNDCMIPNEARRDADPPPECHLWSDAVILCPLGCLQCFLILSLSCSLSRRPPGPDLGHPADAARHWRSHPGLYRRGGDQQRAVGLHAAGLDRYLLQQLPGDPAGLKPVEKNPAPHLDFCCPHPPSFKTMMRPRVNFLNTFGVLHAYSAIIWFTFIIQVSAPMLFDETRLTLLFILVNQQVQQLGEASVLWTQSCCLWKSIFIYFFLV